MDILVDIIGNDNNIIGTTFKKNSYLNHCALRVAGIILFRSNGNIILQKRGKNKKILIVLIILRQAIF